jgi:hypothetical protein
VDISLVPSLTPEVGKGQNTCPWGDEAQFIHLKHIIRKERVQQFKEA